MSGTRALCGRSTAPAIRRTPENWSSVGAVLDASSAFRLESQVAFSNNAGMVNIFTSYFWFYFSPSVRRAAGGVSP